VGDDACRKHTGKLHAKFCLENFMRKASYEIRAETGILR
jgi:hypothetical protein